MQAHQDILLHGGNSSFKENWKNMHIIQLFIKSLKPRRKSLGLTKLRTILKIYYGVLWDCVERK
jgi:hypothetical protein